METAVFARPLFPAPLFAVVGGNVGLGLDTCPDGIHPLQQGFIEAADDARAFGAAVEAAMANVHDDAPCTHEPRRLRQPGCLPSGELLDDDLVAAVRARIGGCAVGDFDKAP